MFKISKQIRNELIEIYEDIWLNCKLIRVYALGRDSKEVVRKIIQIPISKKQRSCVFMLGLNNKDLTKIYLELQQDDLIFCGLVRINSAIGRKWDGNAGYALTNFRKLYFLTVSSMNPKHWCVERCWFSDIIVRSFLRFV